MNNKKSQIQRICFPFIGNKFGATELFALQYILNIDKKKYDPTIIVHSEGPLSSFLKKNKIDYRFIPIATPVDIQRHFPIYCIQMMRSCLRLYWFLLSNEIHKVHTFNQAEAFSWALPCFITLRSHTWHMTKRWINKFRFRFFAGLISSITYADIETKESVPQKYRKKIRRFPLAYKRHDNLDKKKIKKASLMSKQDNKDTCIIGIIANNFHDNDLQEIAANIREEANDKTKVILLINTGVIKHDISAMKSLHAKEISIASRENAYEIAKLIHGLDILINVEKKTTKTNGQFIHSDDNFAAYYSIVAMSAGVPVVAIDEDVASEIITDDETGLLVLRKHIKKSITNCTIKLINNKKMLQQMSKRSIEVFNEEFNIDDYPYDLIN